MRLPSRVRVVLMVVVAAVLGWSFWRSGGWLQLCAGLAVFLFGMQCLEEGLRRLAGGRLEQLLARSTRTPLRALWFGIGGTMLLQSSTLVSLLTIAFVGSGLVQLAGGIAIIFGANLGASSGIWLLALAGQNVSLSPAALPLLVFGVLLGFAGGKGKAAGRILLGVAFIFIAIDQIKLGFGDVSAGLDLTRAAEEGLGTTLLFALGGVLATVVLQSSHATVMLALAAMAGGQIGLDEGMAIAIGSKVGTSISTAVVGMLGGNRAGQRLALAHVAFNVVTACVALLLLALLAWLVVAIAGVARFGDNELLQLALFHTLFNLIGVLLFWPWQARLVALLVRWLPERKEGGATGAAAQADEVLRAKYLSRQALGSADAAAAAVRQELRHLEGLGLGVICQALCLPPEALASGADDDARVDDAPDADAADAGMLYRLRVKGVYGDLLDFMGRMDVPLDEEHQRLWAGSQAAALQLVKAVKDAGELQASLRLRLAAPASPLREAYVDLRRHLLAQLRELQRLVRSPDHDTGARAMALASLERAGEAFDAAMRDRLFAMVRRDEVDGLQAGSLMNDLGNAGRILHGVREAIAFDAMPASLRELEDDPVGAGEGTRTTT